jgi:hypothetical protein
MAWETGLLTVFREQFLIIFIGILEGWIMTLTFPFSEFLEMKASTRK